MEQKWLKVGTALCCEMIRDSGEGANVNTGGAGERDLVSQGAHIRNAMLNILDRLSSLLATMDDARDIHQVLTQEIRAALEELSEWR